MEKIIFTNVLGSFVFDENLRFIEKGEEKALMNKHKARESTIKQSKIILSNFKSKEYFEEFYKKNLVITKKGLKNSVKEDLLVTQTISLIKEQTRVINTLVKRLREWYEIYNPEFSKSVHDHESFVKLIIKKDKKELLKEIKIDEKNTMGADLEKRDLEPMMELAKEMEYLFKAKEKQTEYLEDLMKRTCPNVNEIAGAVIGAELINLAGSLKKLAEMPSSTIQLLGAEKALFRHMRTGAKVPKHGILIQHPLMAKTKKEIHGKVARALADKISIAAKVDYFKGKFVADKLKKMLEEKFS